MSYSSPMLGSEPAPAMAPPWLPALQDPQFWSAGNERVELIETHISWVFLTSRFAYKLKKPVAFDFLDFGSLAARKRACQDEVRLNRRLAGKIYLEILPITEAREGQVELDGAGAVVDYVVKMVRLPEHQRLDLKLVQETLNARDFEPLVRTLTSFYRNAPPLTLRPEEHLASIEHHVRDNSTALLKLVDESAQSFVRRATSMQLSFLKLYPNLLQDRVRDGRFVEGHGDLRPEHIYLTSPPVIVDCIEFNEDFRQLDVADELCFLAMECDRLEQNETGNQLLERCLSELEDHPSERLLAFYKSYRAVVRAKVAALRASQLVTPESEKPQLELQQYLRLAVQYLTPFIPPRLIVIGGLMGSGKSSLASAVANSLGFVHLQTDKLRQDLLGSEDPSEEFGQGKYSSAQREKVYRQLFLQVEEQLELGLSVVLDGTFIERSLRDETTRLAAKYGARTNLVWCICPPSVARQRISARRKSGADASQARPELLDEQLITAELPTVDESPLEIDTTTNWESELAQLLAALAAKLEGTSHP